MSEIDIDIGGIGERIDDFGKSLSNARQDIISAINNKGVECTPDKKLSELPDYINRIEIIPDLKTGTLIQNKTTSINTLYINNTDYPNGYAFTSSGIVTYYLYTENDKKYSAFAAIYKNGQLENYSGNGSDKFNPPVPEIPALDPNVAKWGGFSGVLYCEAGDVITWKYRGNSHSSSGGASTTTTCIIMVATV